MCPSTSRLNHASSRQARKLPVPEDVRGDRIRRKGSESNAESGHLEPEVPLDLGAVALVVLQPRRGVHPGVGLAGVGGGESGGLGEVQPVEAPGVAFKAAGQGQAAAIKEPFVVAAERIVGPPFVKAEGVGVSGGGGAR